MLQLPLRNLLPVGRRFLLRATLKEIGMSTGVGRPVKHSGAAQPRSGLKRSISVVQKKRGRPATGQDPVTAIRLSPELRAQIDAWAERQEDKPSQSIAIRRHRHVAQESPQMTDGIYQLDSETAPDRILVQLKLTPDFLTMVDRWRADRDMSRTKAVYELCALGLAGELLKVNTKAIRRRAADLQK
jgi:hypothetical protein